METIEHYLSNVKFPLSYITKYLWLKQYNICLPEMNLNIIVIGSLYDSKYSLINFIILLRYLNTLYIELGLGRGRCTLTGIKPILRSTNKLIIMYRNKKQS